MKAEQIIGIFASIVVLAGISVAIVNGGKTAQVVTAFGNAFSGSLRVATKGGK
jgi:hypothetical protein